MTGSAAPTAGRGTGRSIIQRPYSYGPSVQGLQASQAAPAVQSLLQNHQSMSAAQYGLPSAPASSWSSHQQHHNMSYNFSQQWQNQPLVQNLPSIPQQVSNVPQVMHPAHPLPYRSLALPFNSGLRHALPAKPQVALDSGPSAGSSTSWQPAMGGSMQTIEARLPRTGNHFTAPNGARRGGFRDTPQRSAPGPSSSRGTWCDTCQVSTGRNDYDLQRHMQEHVSCCKQNEGCAFSAWPQVVELHEQDRHLIFRPGVRREKPTRDGPPDAKIQGTNVSLETEEDIAKWIAERKKKWPGRKNDELRQQRDLKRREYEAASPANMVPQRQKSKRGKFGANGPERGGRGNGRADRSRNCQPHSQPTSEQQDHSSTHEALRTLSEQITASDDEDPQADADVAAQLLGGTAPTVVGGGWAKARTVDRQPECEQNAMAGAILKERAPPGDSVVDTGHLEAKGAAPEEEDDSGPEEHIIVRRTSQSPSISEGQKDVNDDIPAEDASGFSMNGPAQTAPAQRECKAWVSTGNCKFGQRCYFAHDPKRRAKQRVDPPSAPKNPFERGDLIGKLVHHEVKREVSDLAQVIDFLARNSWLENVELYPGHKQDIENRIREVR